MKTSLNKSISGAQMYNQKIEMCKVTAKKTNVMGLGTQFKLNMTSQHQWRLPEHSSWIFLPHAYGLVGRVKLVHRLVCEYFKDVVYACWEKWNATRWRAWASIWCRNKAESRCDEIVGGPTKANDRPLRYNLPLKNNYQIRTCVDAQYRKDGMWLFVLRVRRLILQTSHTRSLAKNIISHT